jgi:xylan 1,4-beta-xylosidase
MSLNRSHVAVIGALAGVASGLALWSQPRPPKPAPVIGRSARYCNPLPMEATSKDGSPQGVSLGDVTVVREGDDYYLFGTGGGGWISHDFVNWKYQAVDVRGGRLPVAPHVAKYDGAFYMSGNDAPLYRAPGILGPYEVLGPWKNEKGEPWKGVSNGVPWIGAFDVDLFVDDDNKPYLYFPGRSTDGIYVAPLDPKDLTRFAAAPKHLFGFDSSKTWERWGDKNEFSNVAWIEGPWMFKHNGTYYIEHSGSGTQWLSYASGVHTSKSPLGPFTYSPKNPLLRKTTGIVTGPGHGCVVKGPDGNWWVFYTIVLANPPGGRRIGMDPVGFDANGNLIARGATETPQWAPGVVSDPLRNGDSGSIPLTVNKLRNLNQAGHFSSQRPGHEAAYALDDSNGTWWEPAEDDAQPTMTVDLGSTTAWDPAQLFTVDSTRIEFMARGGGLGRGGAGTPAPNPPAAGRTKAFRYKIEVSVDGKEYTKVLDKTNNDVTRYTEFDEIPPTQCRFVRLTVTDWPRVSGNPLGIMEFTAFGNPVDASKR